jgi:hypothetical protein
MMDWTDYSRACLEAEFSSALSSELSLLDLINRSEHSLLATRNGTLDRVPVTPPQCAILGRRCPQRNRSCSEEMVLNSQQVAGFHQLNIVSDVFCHRLLAEIKVVPQIHMEALSDQNL